ncbi:reverse transcriptase domain-containing protein [Tanacetum coccineum]
MTRSSANKLFTPYKKPEPEFRSYRRHFKTLSLDKLRSPNFNLFSDQDYSEEEVVETMAETMEQYMSKTRADYGSGVARPKIKEKDNFELKGQFRKELRTNTFSGLDHEDANEYIEKVLEIIDLFHIPNITIDQVMLRAFPMSLTGAASRWLRNKPTGSITTIEDLKTKFSTLYCRDTGGAIPSKTAVDTKVAMKWLNTLKNGIMEHLGCFDNALVDLGASVSVMPLSTYLNLGLGELAHTKLTVKLADRTVKYPKGIAEDVLVGIGKFVFLIDFIILDMPEDIKVPLILGRLFLSTAHAKINVYKRKITLWVEEERIVFTSVKPASSLIKRVYMLSLRERMELDLEARLMEETLVRNQGDDLMLTIKKGKVIEEFRTRDDELDIGIDDYPSYCDYDKKIHIDCAHNLKFSCMIGFEFTHANFFPLLYVNVMSKKFHNSIMKDKMVYKGNNVVGALMNVPIFVGTFFVVTDFAVLENMDAYRDEGIGDVIFGEPFIREVGIKTKRFEGIITIYNGDDEVSEKDEMNGISHAYQKLKGFYKGVLNL